MFVKVSFILSIRQLRRSKIRAIIALIGIAFSVLLIFVQLGFQDALYNSATSMYRKLDADLVLLNSQTKVLFQIKDFYRRDLDRILGINGVQKINDVYIEISAEFENIDKNVLKPIVVIGLNPTDTSFLKEYISPKDLEKIKRRTVALFDLKSRPEYEIDPEFYKSLTIEVNNTRILIDGLIDFAGPTFACDGNLIVSDSTFLTLFPHRNSEKISLGLVKIKPGADVNSIKESIKKYLDDENIAVMTQEELIKAEESYWAEGTAIGFIFKLGTLVGFFVGLVIIYQILHTDISDHLVEYAILKARGYKDLYFTSIVLQESFVLAVLGYIPGCLISILVYSIAVKYTLLPLEMTLERGVFVFLITTFMCLLAGMFASRKLYEADPIDLF